MPLCEDYRKESRLRDGVASPQSQPSDVCGSGPNHDDSVSGLQVQLEYRVFASAFHVVAGL